MEGLEASGTPPLALWFGTGWHEVMAHHYSGPGLKRGKRPLGVWRDYVADEIARIRINKAGEPWHEETYVDAKALGEEMITNYFDEYGKDPTWHIIQPEKPFQVIIKGPAPVLYCGTYDLIYRDLKDDSIWLGEHKTAKAIKTNHLQMDDQAGSYWAIATTELRNAGLIGAKENLRGIMYNFVKKSTKDQRPVNKDGQSLNKDGTVSKVQPAKLFLREHVERSPRERNTQIKRIQDEAVLMSKYRSGELNLIKNTGTDCPWCSFYEMCLLQERGADWEEFRDAVYHKRDVYEDHRDIEID